MPLHPLTRSLRRHPVAWLVLLGVTLRLARYLAGRSLWLDEAMLAQSLITFSWRQLLTQPLMHWQAAPVAYLLLEKAGITMFGSGEFSLRLLSLFSGVAAMILFAPLAKRILDRRGAIIATALFATTESLIYYSSEVKQYEGDVFACVLLLLLALRWMENRRPRDWAALLIAGAVTIFLSHTSIFILGGIAVALVLPPLHVLRERAGVRVPSEDQKSQQPESNPHPNPLPAYRESGQEVAVIVVWIGLFLLNYVYFLRPLTQVAGLQTYWADAFMPHQFISALGWTGLALRDLFANYFALWLPLPEIAILLSLIGLFQFATKNAATRKKLVLLVAPIALALAASATGKFPFSGRVILFTLPLVIILIAAGAEYLISKFRVRWRAIPVIAVLIVLAPSSARSLFFLARPPGHEEIRPMLMFIDANKKPGDVLYCPRLTEIPLNYYLDRFGTSAQPNPIKDLPRIIGQSDFAAAAPLAADLRRLHGYARVWVLITHPTGTPDFNLDEQTRQILNYQGRRLMESHAPGASAYLYDLSIER